MLHSVSKMSSLTLNDRQNGPSVCYVLSYLLIIITINTGQTAYADEPSLPRDVAAHIVMDCSTIDDV